MTLIIGSRGSQLALWQANYVVGRLATLGIDSRIDVIKTTGDHLQTASLVQAGGKGLFTKEIEEALLNQSIDLAVHSLKDLPTENPPDLAIAAIPEREDPSDALVGCTLEELAEGARVGTSSGRRAAQLRMLRPDLRCEPIRGNIDTRLRKLKEGQFDAIMLAAAGLRRLRLEREIAQSFAPHQLCPAPGQGALGIQTLRHSPAFSVCQGLNHELTEQAVTCERAVLASLGGGCQLPVGAYAQVEGDQVLVQAIVVSPDGARHIRVQQSGSRFLPEQVGHMAGEQLLRQGAESLLAAGVL